MKVYEAAGLGLVGGGDGDGGEGLGGGASVTMPMQSGVIWEGAKTTRPLLVVVAAVELGGSGRGDVDAAKKSASIIDPVSLTRHVCLVSCV